MYCRICGDIATGKNYGVISCMSCKVFFQRHGLKNTDTSTNLICNSRKSPCPINRKTRKRCTYCRLTACLQAGMRRNVDTPEDMTRNRQQSEEKHRLLVEQKYTQAPLVTLDLLRADRSSLSVTKWNVISNITHIYDTLFEEHKEKIFHLQNFNEQKPIKIRLKLSNYQQLVATYFTFMIPFLERIPDYQSLDLSDRSILVYHNMITLTGIHSHYMASTTGYIPYFDKNYAPIVDIIYGNKIIFDNEKLRQKLDAIFHTDLILVKLVLIIFAFSNVTPCLTFTLPIISKSMDDEIVFTMQLFQIQNNYLDLLWHYMLYRFRHEEVVIHLYSNIISNCLCVQKFSHQVAEENDLHKDMYDNLVEQLETKLNITDEI